MSGQDIALALSLDAAEANAAIERFNANQALLGERAAAATISLNALQQKQLEMARVQDQLNGGGNKYNQTLRQLEEQARVSASSMAVMVDSASNAGNQVGTLGERFKALGQRIAPQAAAISSISNAMGENAGQAGKVVGAVGQVVSAFGAGGPFGAALVLGTLAVNELTRAWDAELAAQDRALNARVDVKSADYVKSISDRMASLKKELHGPETVSEAFARVSDEIKDAEGRLADFTASMDKTVDNSATLRGLRATIQNLKEIRMLEVERADKNGKPVGTGAGPRAAAAKVAVDDSDDPEIQMMIFRADMAKKASDAANANMLKAFEEKKAIAAKNIDLEKDAAAESLKIMKEQAAEEERIRKEKTDREAAALKARNDFIAGQVQAAAAGLASASQQYLSDRIAGEKHAEEKFAASVMAQAGSALVGYGTQAIGMAALSALNPLTAPLAPAQFAGGAALIAAGIGLGAVAPSLNIGGTSAAKKDAGVNRSPRQSTRTGTDASSGEVYIFNNYGVSGPLADDQVRALERTQARANRRSMS